MTNENPRSTCYRCFRPVALCYCSIVPKLSPKRQVVIVQHQREEFHPLNTTRMVELAVEGSRIVRGNARRLEEELNRHPLPEGAALLFPAPDSLDIAEANAREPISAIVAVDGTWDQAKTLLRLPSLQKVRHVRFTPRSPSEYRIRKEPKLDYLSTLESIALVLETLEPETNVEPLRQLFRTVIDRNIAARPSVSAMERKRVRGRGRAYRPPEVLVETRDAALVYAEAATLSGETGRLHNEPLVICVARLVGGEIERRRLLLRTSSAPREKLLRHLDVSEAEVARGITAEEARDEVLRLIGELPIFAWTSSAQEVLRSVGIERRVAFLKGYYCDYRRAIARMTKSEEPTQWGGLEEVIAKENLRDFPEERARAYRRLLQTEVLFAFLTELARTTARERLGFAEIENETIS